LNPRTHTFKALGASESAQFDSLRGLSAVAVVLGHINQALIGPTYDKASPYLGLLAQSAVMVFFVLSGFLIEKSISRNVDKHRGRFALAQYLGDRVIRIWPPLLLSVTLMVCLSIIGPYVFPSGSREFLPGPSLMRQAFTYDPLQVIGAALTLNGFFTDTPDANGPLWSLSIEVWYYLLAAIIAVPRGWWKLLSIPMAVALFAIGWNNDQFFYYLPVWWIGYLLALLHDRASIPPARYMWGALVLCMLAAIAFGARSVMLGMSAGSERESWHFLIFFNVATGFACCSLLALLLRGSLAVSTIFKPVASYSYTLYIIHVPVLLFVFGIFQPWMQGSLSASLLVAMLAFLGVVELSRRLAMVVENRSLIRSLFSSFLPDRRRD
jgi:peptidoglycan/LPS O-acetylase OafA/YrhL